MITFWKKAHKEGSTSEAFEKNYGVFQEASQEPVFIEKNKHRLKGKKLSKKTKCDTTTLQTAYTNAKQKWSKLIDKNKNGSRLVVKGFRMV